MAVLTPEAKPTLTRRPLPGRHAETRPTLSRAVFQLATGLGLAAAFIVTFVLFVHTTAGQLAENGVVRSAQSGQWSTMDWAGPLRDQDMVLVLGAAWIVLVVVALLRRKPGLLVPALGVLVLPLIAAQLLKLYVLERPDLPDAGYGPGHNSFPSGHVSAAMAILMALAFVLPQRFRPVIIGIGGVAVAWVASSTVALGWHRLSDTAGACLLGASFACLVAAWLTTRRRDLRRTPVLLVVLAAVLPTAIVLVGFAVLSTATDGAAQFVAALVLAALAAVGIVLVALWPLCGSAFERRTGVETRVVDDLLETRLVTRR
ncbi:phosphatase PAP2 family protein [Amycolatopsis alba]|uniref:PAP2 family protein n=1 Tax=Amycolatopsis alba DSM 44262 TaxID=1125972 RepID=A0A229S709_AMYAL|nr:phosphatase PAP2 family protein [Amycolatopsis alba]OXM54732.1 PAP2 family protein [Amycolatopsis alba DSM 44262]